MSYISNRKEFPKEITSYDVLKAVAVILMIVDHIGYYFFPENMWIRVVGRMCVPMWFFLVGYAKSRDMSPILWVGGALLVVMNPIVGMSLFPLNILFTILFVRWVLDFFVLKMLKSRFDAFMGALALAALFIPTIFMFEYGSSAVALALIGYIARNKDELGFTPLRSLIWVTVVTVLFVYSQEFLGFTFSHIQNLILVLGIGCVAMLLYTKFEPATVKTKSVIISFLGRYTLEIYVVHLLIFKLIGVSFGLSDIQWFDFYYLPGGGVLQGVHE